MEGTGTSGPPLSLPTFCNRALNPAFQSQNTRRLPLAFGYVLGKGDQVLSTTQTGVSTVSEAICALQGEGEWDGVEMISVVGGTGIRKHAVSDPAGVLSVNYGTGYSGAFVHFHPGVWTPKGTGVNYTPTSLGGDQLLDQVFNIFPSVTPPQSFSGIVYLTCSVTQPLTRGAGTAAPPAFSPVAIWRATRCRSFDANGNVTGYGFTLNPTWHFVEAVLRYKIKPQTPPLAGLAPAEKACFNWPSIAAHAARNATVLTYNSGSSGDASGNGLIPITISTGVPRFVGNYVFAADATLTNILETILRCCRSYHFVRNGQIYLMGDDARQPTFAMSAKHLVPGSLRLDKKDVAKSPNVFIPKFRDLGVPAVCQVSSVAPSTKASGNMLFHTVTASPFLQGDAAVYGGGSNAASAGEYVVIEPSNSEVGSPGDPNTVGLSYIPNVTAVLCGANATSSSGGYLGTNAARFSQRAPTNVQHRSHQKLRPAQAPGLSVQPNVSPVFYDCGNSTFDQTNRLMKFERDFQLGTDIGPGWTAPMTGTLTAYLEAVDANGKRLLDVNPRDVISLDDWLTPEFAGQYVVMDPIVINPPSETSLGTIELTLHGYNPNAFTDTSDNPGDSYATVPSTNLPLIDPPPVTNACWVLAYAPTYTTSGSGSSATVTLTMTNLVLHQVGMVFPTTYASVTWSGLTLGATYVLYIDDPAATGVSFTPGFQSGPLPLASNPPGRWVVYAGPVQPPAPRSS